MDYLKDRRVVLTLDAGGTTFVFSALRGGQPESDPAAFPSRGGDLEACLDTLLRGFELVRGRAGDDEIAAISFGFPGPADYAAGIIGDLVNLPAFRGGIAIGPMLEEHFGVPVFIRNDGDLFAYGEAAGGLLPWVNGQLETAGNPKRYGNLLGVTLGSGFGAGLVHGGQPYLGDNDSGMEIWPVRDKLEREWSVEEEVSVRGVRRTYARRAGLPEEQAPEPIEIFEIAEGKAQGNPGAAREAFRRMGEVAGDALATAVGLLDAPVVIGGGLAHAAPLFMPALLAEMNGAFKDAEGRNFPRIPLRAFDLEDPGGLAGFLSSGAREVAVPRSRRRVPYDPIKKIGVGLSRLGTSRAVSLGAYLMAIAELDGPGKNVP